MMKIGTMKHSTMTRGWVAGFSMVAAIAAGGFSEARADGRPDRFEDRFVFGQSGVYQSGKQRPAADFIVVDTGSDFGQFSVGTELAQTEIDENDPLEGINRAIFGFNDFVYSYVLGPVADAYGLLPGEIRTVIGSFLSNLRAPLVFANDLLQGEFGRAGNTLLRFGMNSTIGFGGMVDVAESAGYPGHNEDLGQTLAVWGVGDGPYLVLPLLGPSNPRDAIGQYLVEPFVDPFNLYLKNTEQDEWIYTRIGVSTIHQFSNIRSELDQLRRTSVDYYAAVRSLYRQRRAAEINNGELGDLPAIPDFDLGLDEFEPLPAASQPAEPQSAQQLSALPAVSAGTSRLEAPVMAEDETLSGNPLGVRFAPAQQAALISSGYYVVAPRKPSPDR